MNETLKASEVARRIEGFGFLYAALREGLDNQRLTLISHDWQLTDSQLRMGLAMSSCSPLAMAASLGPFRHPAPSRYI